MFKKEALVIFTLIFVIVNNGCRKEEVLLDSSYEKCGAEALDIPAMFVVGGGDKLGSHISFQVSTILNPGSVDFYWMNPQGDTIPIPVTGFYQIPALDVSHRGEHFVFYKKRTGNKCESYKRKVVLNVPSNGIQLCTPPDNSVDIKGYFNKINGLITHYKVGNDYVIKSDTIQGAPLPHVTIRINRPQMEEGYYGTINGPFTNRVDKQADVSIISGYGLSTKVGDYIYIKKINQNLYEVICCDQPLDSDVIQGKTLALTFRFICK